MNEIHALSGAYAIDALDDLERAQFERHLAECRECRAEVDSLREASGLLAETSPATPPAALRDRVLADITKVRPLPPLTGESPETPETPEDQDDDETGTTETIETVETADTEEPSRPATVTHIGHGRRWLPGWSPLPPCSP